MSCTRGSSKVTQELSIRQSFVGTGGGGMGGGRSSKSASSSPLSSTTVSYFSVVIKSSGRSRSEVTGPSGCSASCKLFDKFVVVSVEISKFPWEINSLGMST